MKEKVLKLLQTAKAIVRVLLQDGLYYAQKVNDDYVILYETAEGWRELPDGETADTVIILTDVLDLVTKTIRTIAVNVDFVNWALKTNFVFRVTKGRTQLVLNTFTNAQMKQLLGEEQPA